MRASADSITLHAPAKLNLFLKLVGRRADGYHLLESLMVPISLCDTLKIKLLTRVSEIRVTSDDPAVPSGKDNLAYRAASLFLKNAGLRCGVSVRIRKRIPIGGGFGGGSSDAATVLKGLNRLSGRRMEKGRLVRIARQLGADVPFFISCKPARVSGIGEKVRVVPRFPGLWLLLIYPGFGIQTSAVYRRVRLTKVPEKTSNKAFVRRGVLNVSSLRNDLEAVATILHPEIRSMKKRLVEQGAEAALMTGSGSSVFGVFSSRQMAEKARRAFETRPGERIFLARSVRRWAVAKR